jgi:cobalt-zinc-cadmium efflux system outer membrane protein
MVILLCRCVWLQAWAPAARISLTTLLVCCAVSVESAFGQAAPPRPLGRDLPVYRPARDEAGQPPAGAMENPTDQIALRDALALALQQNPELAAFAWEVRAREARALQAGRRPNPIITSDVEDLGASVGPDGPDGGARPQTTILLSQIIELGGKRVARQRAATLSRDLADWDFETARIDVLTRVARAYVDVLTSQQAVALARQSVGIAEAVRQAVAARVGAGVVSPIEQTKAEVAAATARIEANRAERALDADRRSLAALWGAREARFASASGDLAVVPEIPAFETLQAQLSENPELARWAAEIAQREAALDVERSRRVPDVAIGAGYRRLSAIDANALVVSASLGLPIFDRNRDAVREASARVNRALAEQRASEARVTTLLADAYRTLATARDEVTALASDVLPGARSAFDAVQEGYRLGRFGLLEVLDAQRTLVGANAQYLRALSDFHKAAADVERLVGAPLSPAGSAGGIR